MNKIIQYAVDRDSGGVVSQVGSEYAWPILDYEAIGQGGDFTGPMQYNLEKIDRYRAGRVYLHFTKRVPTEVKNIHRAFWGMPAVKPIPNEAALLERYWKRHSKAVFGA